MAMGVHQPRNGSERSQQESTVTLIPPRGKEFSTLFGTPKLAIYKAMIVVTWSETRIRPLGIEPKKRNQKKKATNKKVSTTTSFMPLKF